METSISDSLSQKFLKYSFQIGNSVKSEHHVIENSLFCQFQI